MKTQRPAVLISAIVLLLTQEILLGFAPFFPDKNPDPGSVIVVSGGVVLVEVLGLVAAFGLWKLKRWGMRLSIIVSILSASLSAGGIVFATSPIVKGLGVVLIALCALIIVLVLVPSARQAYAADQVRMG
jgi:peptidoglycan/LPS O-acetylase OafA/YrhL